MSYDSWKTRSPDDCLPQIARCERCNAKGSLDENEYGEFVCASCVDNEAERAWERHCTDYEGPLPLRDQQIAAKKLR